MKIRIIGTSGECAAAREYYSGLEKQENVQSVSISRLYPCRDSNALYRLYVEVSYYAATESGCTAIARLKVPLGWKEVTLMPSIMSWR